MNIGFWSSLKRAHEFAGVAAFAGAVLAAVGFSLNPPWPTHKDFEDARAVIEQVRNQQAAQIVNAERQNCFIIQLLKDRYAKEQADAQEELNKNPASPTLQRSRDEAKAWVEYLDNEQRTARCHHQQAPTSSYTDPAETPGQWIMDRIPRSAKPRQQQTMR